MSWVSPLPQVMPSTTRTVASMSYIPSALIFEHAATLERTRTCSFGLAADLPLQVTGITLKGSVVFLLNRYTRRTVGYMWDPSPKEKISTAPRGLMLDSVTCQTHLKVSTKRSAVRVKLQSFQVTPKMS